MWGNRWLGKLTVASMMGVALLPGCNRSDSMTNHATKGSSALATSSSSDLSADFSTESNPNGVWTYGWEPTLGGTFGNDTHTGDFIAGVDEYSSPIQYMSIWHNRTSSPIVSGSLTLQPGKVVLHPGPSGQYSVVRWTAPASDSYAVNAVFSGVDSTPTTTDVHVLRGSSSVFASTVDGNSLSTTYSNTLTIAAGTTLDFAVGNGGNNYYDDATQLDVSIVAQGTGIPDPDGGSSDTVASDLAGDFSTDFNPNTVWAYGWSASGATSGFTLDSVAGDFVSGVDQYTSPIQYMSIWHNRTNSTIVSGPLTFQPGQVVLHPGPSGEHSMVRWTAPATGNYDIHARFDGVDSAGTTSDVNMVLNGSVLHSGELTESAQSVSFDDVGLSLSAGDELFLTVGYGSNSTYFDDATQVSATITGTVSSTDGGPADAGPTSGISNDFSTESNPNGVWTYGWEPTLGGTFGNDTHTGDFIAGVDEYSSPIQYMSIWHNRTSSPIVSGSLTLQPGKVVLHPGPSGQYSVVRWTAPASDSYAVNAVFSGVDSTPTTTDVHVLHNNSGLFDAELNLDMGSNTAQYSTTVALSAGDSLDFAVGNGGNDYYDDATQLDLTIVSTSAGL